MLFIIIRIFCYNNSFLGLVSNFLVFSYSSFISKKYDKASFSVSNVKVMITLDISSIEVKDSQINMSKFPKIKGVLITANGVNNTSVKMKVLHAVETVIDVEQGQIEILSSE